MSKIEIVTDQEYATTISNLLEVWHDNRELTKYWSNTEYQHMMLEYLDGLSDAMLEQHEQILESKFQEHLQGSSCRRVNDVLPATERAYLSRSDAESVGEITGTF